MTTLLSCADLARTVKRSPSSIFRSIKRLKIKAEYITPGGFHFYNPNVLKKLDLRRPNRKSKIGNRKSLPA